MIYLIGSLRNPKIPSIASHLRGEGVEVFDDWYAAGEKADDAWRDYEKLRGRTYPEALAGLAARHVFEFDKTHLDRADAAVLVAPAGKSAHLELGYILGKEKPGFILLEDEPERWDVMLQFAWGVFFNMDDLIIALREERLC